MPFALGPVPATKAANATWQNTQYLQSRQALEKVITQRSGQGDIYIPNRPFSVFRWGYTPDQFPGLAALFVVIYPSNSVDGKRVFFLEESEEIVRKAQAQHGTRISQLLIHKPVETAKQ